MPVSGRFTSDYSIVYMDCFAVIYIISLSFQISGSIILLIGYLKCTRRLVISNAFKYSIGALNGGPEKVIHKKIAQRSADEIILNRFSFGYLLIGFILSVFSEKGDSLYLVLTCIAVCSIVMVTFALCLSCCISYKKYSNDIPINESDLKSLVGSESYNETMDEEDIQKATAD